MGKDLQIEKETNIKEIPARELKSIPFPIGLYLEKGLTWTEKIIILEIYSLDRGEGCYASNEYLAGFVNVSEGRLANVLTKLRQNDWVVCNKFDGRRRWISIHPSKRELWFQASINANELRNAGFTKTLKQDSQKSEAISIEDNNSNKKGEKEKFKKEKEDVGSDDPPRHVMDKPLKTVGELKREATEYYDNPNESNGIKYSFNAFLEVWDEYPPSKRRSMRNAFSAWHVVMNISSQADLDNKRGLIEKILIHISESWESDRWQRGFVPSFSKYFREYRWEGIP